jgi:transposase-like protein
MEKMNFPDSDESAREKHPDAAEQNVPEADTSVSGLQTSNKSGKHSTAEKLAASRPEFGTGRGAIPVDGAFGKDNEVHEVTGRRAGSNTNQFRCDTCGRYFNTQEELSEHQPECRLAKAATQH